MKKLPVIMLAILAAAAITMTGCDKNGKPSDKDKTQNEAVKDTGETKEGELSLDDALAKLEEAQPKTDLDKENIATAGGIPVSAADAKYANISCKAYYDQSGQGDDAEAIKNEIETYYKLNAAIMNLARKNSLRITEQDFEDNITAQIESLKSQYSDEYDTIFDTSLNQTPYLYFNSTVLNLMYQSLFDKYYGENGDADMKKEAYEATLKTFTDGDYVRAKHILIQFPEDAEKDADGNVTEASKAATLEKANAVLAEVQEGKKTFDELVTEYGEDPGMKTFPMGYYFSKGKMVQQFEDAAYALDIDGISGLVETSYGYHIIQRLALEDEEAVMATDEYQTTGFDKLQEMLTKESESYSVEYGENYQTKVDGFLADYAAAQEAQKKAQEQAQAQAQTDGAASAGTSAQ